MVHALFTEFSRSSEGQRLQVVRLETSTCVVAALCWRTCNDQDRIGVHAGPRHRGRAAADPRIARRSTAQSYREREIRFRGHFSTRYVDFSNPSTSTVGLGARRWSACALRWWRVLRSPCGRAGSRGYGSARGRAGDLHAGPSYAELVSHIFHQLELTELIERSRRLIHDENFGRLNKHRAKARRCCSPPNRREPH